MNSELVIPADRAHVRTARVVAAVAARRSGVTGDEIESVRLAVDEACGLMIRTAESGREPNQPRSTLAMSIADSEGRFSIEVSGEGAVDRERPGPDDEIALTIMAAVAPMCSVDHHGGQVTVRFAWEVGPVLDESSSAP